MRRSAITMIVAVAASTAEFTTIVRTVYGDRYTRRPGDQRGFGEAADGRLQPVLRD